MTEPTIFVNLEKQAGSNINMYLAVERTRMASERTLFSLIRTGFTIAGGGVLITNILAGDNWVTWLTALFSAIFVTVGFAFILVALHRYHQVVAKIEKHDGIDPIPSRLISTLVVLLQLTFVFVLVVFFLE